MIWGYSRRLHLAPLHPSPIRPTCSPHPSSLRFPPRGYGETGGGWAREKAVRGRRRPSVLSPTSLSPGMFSGSSFSKVPLRTPPENMKRKASEARRWVAHGGGQIICTRYFSIIAIPYSSDFHILPYMGTHEGHRKCALASRSLGPGHCRFVQLSENRRLLNIIAVTRWPPFLVFESKHVYRDYIHLNVSTCWASAP